VQHPQLDVLFHQECLEFPGLDDLPQGLAGDHAAVLVDDQLPGPSLDEDEEDVDCPARLDRVEPVVLGAHEQQPAPAHPDADEMDVLAAIECLHPVVKLDLHSRWGILYEIVEPGFNGSIVDLARFLQARAVVAQRLRIPRQDIHRAGVDQLLFQKVEQRAYLEQLVAGVRLKCFDDDVLAQGVVEGLFLLVGTCQLARGWCIIHMVVLADCRDRGRPQVHALENLRNVGLGDALSFQFDDLVHYFCLLQQSRHWWPPIR